MTALSTKPLFDLNVMQTCCGPISAECTSLNANDIEGLPPPEHNSDASAVLATCQPRRRETRLPSVAQLVPSHAHTVSFEPPRSIICAGSEIVVPQFRLAAPRISHLSSGALTCSEFEGLAHEHLFQLLLRHWGRVCSRCTQANRQAQ